MVAAVAKLDKAATASDDSERAKKVFQSKADEDEKRIIVLEKDLKEAREKAEAADATYDEVAKSLAECESSLEKTEERADVGETKILELEEELRVVANNLKSLEVGGSQAGSFQCKDNIRIQMCLRSCLFPVFAWLYKGDMLSVVVARQSLLL